jgi:hypothetical protein
LVKGEHWKASADTLRTLIPLWQEDLCDHKRLRSRLTFAAERREFDPVE